MRISKVRAISLAVLVIVVMGSLVLSTRVFATASYDVFFTQTGAIKQPTVQYSLSNGTMGSKATPFTLVVQSGLKLTYAYEQDVKAAVNGTRYAFVSVAPASPQTITSVLSISATYQTQYQVTFNQTGSAVAPSVFWSLTNGTSSTNLAPFSIWVNASPTSTISYSYQTNPSIALDVSYTLTNVTTTNGFYRYQVTGPVTLNATYQKLLSVGGPAWAVYDPQNGYTYVADDFDPGYVSVIDGNPGSTTENTIVGTISVGPYPDFLLYDSLNGNVYVTNSGTGSDSGGALCGEGSAEFEGTGTQFYCGTVSVISGLSEIASIQVGVDPGRIAVDPSTGDLFVSNQYSDNVSVIDPTTNTVVKTICTDDECPEPTDISTGLPELDDDYNPFGIAYDPANGLMYVSDFNGPDTACGCAIVQAIDPSTYQIVANITFGSGDPGTPVYDPANQNIYVPYECISGTNCPTEESANGTVEVIDSATDAPLGVVDVGQNPVRVVVDSSNGEIYVANNNSGTVSVIDGSTNTLLKNIDVGGAPSGLFYDSSNDYVYVTNFLSNETSVIDGNASSAKENTVLEEIPSQFIGLNPAFDTSNLDLYVCNEGSGSITIIYTGSPNSISFSPNSGGVKEGFTTESVATINGTADNAYLYSNLPSGSTISLDWGVNPVPINPTPIDNSLTISPDPGTPVGTTEFVVNATSPNGATGSGTYTVTVIGYTIDFDETGLPSGTSWSVSLPVVENSVTTGYSTSTSSTNQVVFLNQPGGNVKWNISSSISGGSGIRYVPALASGSMNIISDTSLALTSYTTQYAVTFQVSPANSGSTSPKAGVINWDNAGSTISIGATNSSGYAFSSWSANTSAISISNAAAKAGTAKISGPGMITASFYDTVSLRLNSTAGAVRQGDYIVANFTVSGAPQSVSVTNKTLLPKGASITFDQKTLTDSINGIEDGFVINTSSAILPQTGTFNVTLVAKGANGQQSIENYTLVILSPTATKLVIPTSSGKGNVTVTTSAGAFYNVSAISLQNLPQAGRPSGVSFPFGLFSWTVDGLTKGQTISVSLTFPSRIHHGFQYWKFVNGNWVNATSLITSIHGNTTTLTITDGGFGDSDGVANGQITDPGGLGYTADVANGTIPVTPSVSGSVYEATGVAYDSGNGYLYVTEDRTPTGSANVSVVNPSTDEIVASIPVEGISYNGAIAYDPANGFLYVPSDNGIITVIDGATNSVVNSIVIPPGSATLSGSGSSGFGGIAYDADNGYLYLPGGSSSVYVINPSSGVVAGQVLIENAPADGLGQIVYDPSNGFLYQAVPGPTAYDNSSISVIDGSNNSVVATIPITGTPVTLAYDSNNAQVLVTNTFIGSNVTIIDTSGNTVSSSFQITGSGFNSAYSVYDSETDQLFISNGENTVFVLNMQTNSVVSTIEYPSFQYIVFGITDDASNCNVYVVLSGGTPYSGYLSTIPTGCAAPASPPSGTPPSPPDSASSTISVGSGPSSVVLDTASHELFIADAGSDSISVVSESTGTVVASIPLEFPGYHLQVTPSALVYDPANGNIYVLSYTGPADTTTDGSFLVINGTTNSIIDFSGGSPTSSLSTFTFPQGGVFDPTDNEVLVSGAGSTTGNILLIDSASSGQYEGQAYVAYNPYGIVFDSSNGYVYVANSVLSGSVSVLANCEPFYYAPTCQVIKTIQVGSAPTGEVFDPANGYIYVADSGSNAVSVIDGSTNKLIANISVGSYPASLAYDSSSSEILVSNELSGTISVIDATSNTVAATVQIGPNPDGIVYDASNCNAYVANNVQSGMISVLSTGCSKISSSQVQVTFVQNGSGVNPTVSYNLSNGTSGSGVTPFTINVNSESSGGDVSPKPISPGTVLSVIPASTSPFASPNAYTFDPQNGLLYGASNIFYVVNASSNTLVTTVQPTGYFMSDVTYDSGNGLIYFLQSDNPSYYYYQTNFNASGSGTFSGTPTSFSIQVSCPYEVFSGYSCTGEINFTSLGLSEAVTGTLDGIAPNPLIEPYSITFSNGCTFSGVQVSEGTLICTSPSGIASTTKISASNGEANEGLYALDPSTNTISFISTLGLFPQSLTYDPANGNLYSVNELSYCSTGSPCSGYDLYVINGTTNSVQSVIPNPEGLPPGTPDDASVTTADVLYNPLNSEIYILGTSDHLTAFNPATDKFVANITGDGLCCDNIAYANGEVFISNSYLDTVTVVNSTNSVVATIPVGLEPSTSYEPVYDVANRNLYVFCQGELDVISTTTNTLVNSVPISVNLGGPSNGILTAPAFNPMNNGIYLPDSNDGLVAVFNVTTDTMMPGITTLEGSQVSVEYDPLSGTVYAVNGYTTLVLGTPSPPTLSVSSPLSISYSYQDVVPGESGTQYVLTSVNPQSPQTATGSLVVNGTYATQYQVTFGQSGLDSTATGTILNINGSQFPFSGLPFSEYVDSGSTLDFSYTGGVPSSGGGTFVLTAVSGNTTDSTLLVSEPSTVTGQYTLTQGTSTATTTATTTTTTTSFTTTTSILSTTTTSLTTVTSTSTSTATASDTATSDSTITSTTTVPVTTTSGICDDPTVTQTLTSTSTITSTLTDTSTSSYTTTITGTVTTVLPTTVTITTTTVVPVTSTQTVYSTTVVCSSTVETSSSSSSSSSYSSSSSTTSSSSASSSSSTSTTSTSSSSSSTTVTGVPEFPLGSALLFLMFLTLVMAARVLYPERRRK